MVCSTSATGDRRIAPDVQPVTTDDAFLGATLRILQPENGYRAGFDAVFLAATVPDLDRPQTRVLDVGAGVGVVGLAIAARVPGANVVLIERQRALCSLAAQNIARNRLDGRVTVVAGDVLAATAAEPGHGDHARDLEAGTFDQVVSNPPFFEIGTIRPPVDVLKAHAHALEPGGLGRWVAFMAAMARPGGTATMIHRADCVVDVASAFAKHFGELLIQPLHPRQTDTASRIIVRGTKGSRAPTKLLPGIVLHGSSHGFRADIDKVLRSPTSWPL